jgi:hypothetical protein
MTMVLNPPRISGIDTSLSGALDETASTTPLPRIV